MLSVIFGVPQKIKHLLFAAICFSLLLSFWWILHNDMNFSSDIARDFLLFREIDQKGIILIGPKSSVMGLFHGPAWLYLNYPAYFFGQGNPLAVGWFWIILIILFVASCYIIGKKLFDEATGLIFAALSAIHMFFHSKELFNPYGAMFLIPTNFYLIVKYFETFKLRYLIIYTLLLGFLIQFQLAIGIPLLILSLVLLSVRLFKTNKKAHILSLGLVLIPLLNFIIFDFRHNFLILNSALRYLSPSSGDPEKYNLLFMVYDRLKLMVTNVEILRFDPFYRNAVMGAIFIFLLINQVRSNKYRRIYYLFLYFYIGYFATTLVNRGPILYFYFFPFFPLVFLIFSSFSTSKYKKVFFIILAFVFLMNVNSALSDISESGRIIGKAEDSWKFLNTMSSRVFSGPEPEFGYFVYTPDIIGYAPKYALFYQQRRHPQKIAHYFQKKPITYVIVAPPARDNPYLSYDWWKEERLKLDLKPISETIFPNGYKIEKYQLSNSQIKIPFDPGIDPGLNFR